MHVHSALDPRSYPIERITRTSASTLRARRTPPTSVGPAAITLYARLSRAETSPYNARRSVIEQFYPYLETRVDIGAPPSLLRVHTCAPRTTDSHARANHTLARSRDVSRINRDWRATGGRRSHRKVARRHLDGYPVSRPIETSIHPAGRSFTSREERENLIGRVPDAN